MHLSWFSSLESNMIVPDISLHTGRCVDWEKTGADWVTVPLFFLGAFAGANKYIPHGSKIPEAGG